MKPYETAVTYAQGANGHALPILPLCSNGAIKHGDDGMSTVFPQGDIK